MFEVYVLASGSKGNATIVHSGETTILIDCGLIKKQLHLRLAQTPYRLDNVDAVLFTHLHGDHYRDTGVHEIDSCKHYGSFRKEGMPAKNYLKPFEAIKIKEIKITPLVAVHDCFACDVPLGYRLENAAGEVLIYMSDTGVIIEENIPFMENANYYMLESNYDPLMELNSGRDPMLIERVMGETGHLSNEDSALYAFKLVGPKTEKIILLHLSEEANTEAKALEQYKSIFAHSLMHQQIEIKAARQSEVVKL